MRGMPISTVRTASKAALHCSRTKVRSAAMLGFYLPNSASEYSVVIQNKNMLMNSYIRSTLTKFVVLGANFSILNRQEMPCAIQF